MTPPEARIKPDDDDSILVFVSYAREDADFVSRLERALPPGVRILFDRQEIADFEPWWKRIVDLVVKAHTVLFVISPDWLQSETCQNELKISLDNNKRLAPVIYRDVPSDRVPEALRQINWVFVDKDFEIAVSRLVEGFETDIEWIREYTRLSEQARDWVRRNRSEAAISLSDDSLSATQTWLDLRPVKAPAPTEQLLDYLRTAGQVLERKKRERAELLDRALVSQSRMLAERAEQLLEQGDAVSAILLSLEALPDESRALKRPFVRDAEIACTRALYDRRERRVFPLTRYENRDAVFGISIQNHGILDVALTDDGSRLLAITEKGICAWDTESGKLLTNLDAEKAILSTDGKRAVTFGESSACLWKLDSSDSAPELLQEFELKDQTNPGKLFGKSERGWVAVKGRLHLVEFKGKGQLLPLRDSLPIKDDYDTVAFSTNGKRIVTTPAFTYAFPTTVRTWDSKTGQLIAELEGHESHVRNAELSPDGSLVATASADQTARVWNAETGECLFVLRGHGAEVACARFSPDASMLVTGSFDNSFCVWKVSTGEKIAVLRGHAGEVARTTDIFKGFSPAARFSSDGSQVVTSWQDQTARLWDREAGKDLNCVLAREGSTANSVAFHPDGSQFATSSDDNSILFWDAQTKLQRSAWTGLGAGVGDLAFTSDGKVLAALVGDRIILWNVADGKKLKSIPAGGWIRMITFSSDGSKLAAATGDEAIVWDVNSGKEICRFSEGFTGYCVQIAPSGMVAISCGDERAVRLWNIETGKQISSAIFHGTSVLSVAFDRQGRRVVTGCDDRTSRIWTVGTEPSQKNVIVLSGHDRGVTSAAFSPNGEQVVTASEDKTVRVWNSESGASIAVFAGHTEGVTKAVFSPGGDQIVSVSSDGTIRVWQLFPTTQALVNYAKRVVPRALTPEQRLQLFLDPDPPAWCVEQGKWPY